MWPLQIKLLDETIRTMIVDGSLDVIQLIEIIGKKMGISNTVDFSLMNQKEN